MSNGALVTCDVSLDTRALRTGLSAPLRMTVSHGVCDDARLTCLARSSTSRFPHMPTSHKQARCGNNRTRSITRARNSSSKRSNRRMSY
jgi:hypothetical protein